MTTTRRGERVEAVAQVVIMLAIGTMAAAASFTHVHDVTVAHGQPDWIGWANSVVLELMSIAAGLELRRRKRTRRPAAFVVAVLVVAVGLSLAAQVAEAEPTFWGWTVAALPALGFLALIKIVLSRTDPTADPPPALTPAVTAQPATTETSPDSDGSVPAELLTGARMAAFTHRQNTGQPITTAALAEHLAIPVTVASDLLHHLGETGAAAGTASPVMHPNGTGDVGGRA